MQWNSQKIVIIGFGSIGQAIAPALIRDLGVYPASILAICADEAGADIAKVLGIRHANNPLYLHNYEKILEAELNTGDWLLNLSVDVSSQALLAWCQAHDVFYLDTCVEPWAGGYDPEHGVAATNFKLREAVLKLQTAEATRTAVIAHGANPGLVSHFVKAGLEELAGTPKPENKTWGQFAQSLKVQVIQIAEQDTQIADMPEQVFANTWSVDGFLSEAYQRGEAGFGSHEDENPGEVLSDEELSADTLIFTKSSVDIKVKSWTPAGKHEGYLITHHEAISIASHFATEEYRPTVYYAYKPTELTCRGLETWKNSGKDMKGLVKKVIRDEIISGADYLGVLLITPEKSLWYGSILDIAEARNILPFNNATSCQVVGGIIGAMRWMLRNPNEGICEAENLPHEEVLREANPYLGQIVTAIPESFEYSGTTLRFFLID